MRLGPSSSFHDSHQSRAPPYHYHHHSNQVISGSQSRSRRSSKDGSLDLPSAGPGAKTSDVYLAQELKRSESFSRGLTRVDSKGTPIVNEFTEMDLEIHEDAQGEVYVKDMTLVPVNSADEINIVIAEGLKLRATHETKMNAVSSRSHTVFSIVVTQTDKATGEGFSGKIHLVDLAGSERLKKSEVGPLRWDYFKCGCFHLLCIVDH